ncbi:glycine cleavage T C-terminal barrel domain-containing protein [Brachybacterium saurashtrense]|uniref:Glycine cleavage system protein T n=1 Tax=Brachybacterium saurashtrense TaxID=556288 RepID=A0A345YNE0_9MICO|nr:glycine cleavage T C-terminal barrel domain-containing protein [Brachybacterium saurashtrense]AXK45442.1 glycine cleavage system protein T [Brachybacterium saurashtrense]RRR21185.1 glycine cleavage system protein T [Brachybacterium saurashtrense]
MTVNPDPGVLLYPRIRKSPFFYASRQHGVALYSVYNHTYHPRHYGDPLAEYWALLEGVTLWDVGVERQIEISGPDAFDFTNLLVTRDLSTCKVGQCKYVFLCDQHGGILNDPILLRVEENRFWLSLADSDILLWARGVAAFAGMDVRIEEIDVGPVQVQGPKSYAVLRDLVGEAVADIRYYYLHEFTIDGIEVIVSRTGYTGEIGYEIYVKNASRDAEKLWARVLEAGEPHGLRVIGPCHMRRIEGGMLAHGADITVDTNPFEVGMGYDWMVDLDQEADFLGKEALRRIKEEGPRRKLVGLEIGGEKLGTYNDGSMIDAFPVLHGGEVVGKVTSACHSPRLEKNIGLALVPAELAALGTAFTVDVGERLGAQLPSGLPTVDAVVVPKPFIDPTKEQPKADVAALAGEAAAGA